MPAETHQQRDDVTAEEIVDLLVAVIGAGTDAEVDPASPLVDLGLDSDLALLDLADVVAEEYGERSLGELDLDDLSSARTVGDLAAVFARAWAGVGDDEESGDRGRAT